MIAKWCVAKILQQQRQRYDDTAVMKPEQFENSRMRRNKLLHLVRRFEIRPYRHDNPKSAPYVYPTPTGLTISEIHFRVSLQSLSNRHC